MKLLLVFLTAFLHLTIYSQTKISGGIFKNTTYTLAKSPYEVTNDLVVFPGVKLTIEAGVVLKFDSSKSLEVRGEIVANGNDTARIAFTSNLSSPDNSSWTGIEISNSLGAKASFEFCDFKYAVTASTVECCHQGGPIDYKNCLFEENFVAMDGYTAYDINVDNCEFTNNLYAINSADKAIKNSLFTHNKIAINGTERVDIDSSTFKHNGIAVKGSDGELKNSIIDSNRIGVDNSWEGFTVTNNIITYNDTGIRIGSTSNGWRRKIKDNEICFNKFLNAENTTKHNIDLTDNCWCLNDSTEIEDKIKDGYDDLDLGLANYSIYDSTCSSIDTSVLKHFIAVSIDEANSKFERLRIYPNPAKDNITIDFLGNIDNLDIKIYSIGGKLIQNYSQNNASLVKIPLTNIPSGIYFVQIFLDGEVVIKKLIKE